MEISKNTNLLSGDLGLQQHGRRVLRDHLLEVGSLGLKDAADASFKLALVLPHGGGVSTVIQEHSDGGIFRSHKSDNSGNAQL